MTLLESCVENQKITQNVNKNREHFDKLGIRKMFDSHHHRGWRGRKERSTCKEMFKEIFKFEVNIEWYGVYFKPN